MASSHRDRPPAAAGPRGGGGPTQHPPPARNADFRAAFHDPQHGATPSKHPTTAPFQGNSTQQPTSQQTLATRSTHKTRKQTRTCHRNSQPRPNQQQRRLRRQRTKDQNHSSGTPTKHTEPATQARKHPPRRQRQPRGSLQHNLHTNHHRGNSPPWTAPRPEPHTSSRGELLQTRRVHLAHRTRCSTRQAAVPPRRG